MKLKHKYIILPLIVMVFTAISAFTTYGSETETITQQYTFKSKNSEDKGKSFDETITVNKKKYTLKDTQYKVVDKTELKVEKNKTITLTKKSTGEYSPKKKIVQNGVTFILDSTKTNERTVKKEEGRVVTGYLSFDSKDEAMNAPDKRTFSANGATAVCEKQNMVKEKAVSWQSSYIDFTFTSEDKDYYEWNGKEIDGNSANPLKGYDQDILKSIGADSKNYKIGDTYWKGKAHYKNGIYTRILHVEVKKKVPHYRVNYKGYSKGKTQQITEYIMTYKGKVLESTGEYEYRIMATATYEHEEVKAPLVLKIGVIVFAIIITGVLFIIYLKPERFEDAVKLKKHRNK